MNKCILLILGLVSSTILSAQDMMLLRNVEEMHCKVEMISNVVVNYLSNGAKGKLPTTQLYMIKYEKRGNSFFNSEGESSYKSEPSSNKMSDKDISIYLCEGGEIIVSDIEVTNDEVYYRLSPGKKGWNAITGLLPNKKSEDWIAIPKDSVFLIRYFDGTREVINDLQKIENQARIEALPKVKHPFIPINKDGAFPCAAEIELKDGTTLSVVIYDVEREYVYYRKAVWPDGPVYRLQRRKIKQATRLSVEK
jgi:hypothetical protein